MNIIIVGDGGIGSNLSLPLIKFIKYYKESQSSGKDTVIKIVDGDTVEIKNLLRQHFIKEDCGLKKADVTSIFLNEVCDNIKVPNIIIESIPVYLKEDNVEIIEEGSIVLVGVDNYITRKIIENRALSLSNILVIFGGNEYDDGDVNVLWIKDGVRKTELYQNKHPEILKRDKFPDEIGCEEAASSSPQLIFANMMVANFMLEALYNYLSTGVINWHEKIFDMKTGNVRTIHV